MQLINENKNALYVDISDVTSGFYRFATATRKAVESYLDEQCKELEMYMKSNHPWNNRTGNAERGLEVNRKTIFGKNIAFPTTFQLQFSHGVSYGLYLEWGMELRFAILEPTARLKGSEVLYGMHGIIEEMGWKKG